LKIGFNSYDESDSQSLTKVLYHQKPNLKYWLT